jgi:hypothetical protein
MENLLIKKEFLESKRKNLRSLYPSVSDEQIERFLKMEIEKNYYSPECVIDNNYTNKQIKTSLGKIIDWLEKKRPITTEHGVMFKRHEEAINLNADLLKLFIDSRKIEKNLMFECIERGDKIGQNVHDTKQKIHKILANS